MQVTERQWPWQKLRILDHAFYDVMHRKVLFIDQDNEPSAWHIHSNFYTVRKLDGSLCEAHVYISRLRLRRFRGFLSFLGYLFPLVEKPMLTVTLRPLNSEGKPADNYGSAIRSSVSIDKHINLERAFAAFTIPRQLFIVENLGTHYVPYW